MEDTLHYPADFRAPAEHKRCFVCWEPWPCTTFTTAQEFAKVTADYGEQPTWPTPYDWAQEVREARLRRAIARFKRLLRRA